MTTTRKPPRQSLARIIASPGHDGETVFDLPSKALCVGDPVTDFGGRVALGVERVSIFLHDVGFNEDTVAIVARVRPSVAVRWEIAPTGGVDSGVFGVWDAESRMTSDAHAAGVFGAGVIGGRRVFALRTGDGGFPCVVGRDAQGEIAALVAGPGVNPARLRATVREEDLSPEERAELAAKAAREKRLAAADLLGSRLGEDRASPPLRWFVAGWLESLPEAERDAARERIRPAVEALALPATKKRAREHAKADTAALLAWALSGWATVLSATMPEAAARLVMGDSIDKEQMAWAEALARVFDGSMTGHHFDLTRPYAAYLPGKMWYAVAMALPDVPPDLAARFGLTGLDVMVEKTRPHKQLADAFWYAARGLEASLKLHVLATRAADLPRPEDSATEGGAALRPRSPDYVEALLAGVEGPVELLLRLARRGTGM